MGVVFEREFKALFRSIKAVICMVAFIFASGILLLVNNLLTGYSAIQAVFSNMSLVAALAVPPVAASLICGEGKKGTERFLAALPVSRKGVILGKFLAAFAFFMIPSAVMALYPIVLALSGAATVLQGYLVLFMFVLAVAFFIALALMLSAIFKKVWVATLVSYAVNVVLFIIGMLSALFGGTVEEVLRWVSPFRRFDPIVFDLFDIASVIFYITFTALFLALAIIITGKRKAEDERVRAKSKKAAILAATMAVVVVILNVSTALIPKALTQLDVSTNQLYGVSSSTEEYIKGLNEDITVYLINPTASEEKLHTYIKRFCALSPRITLKEIDTAKDTEFLEKYGISTTPSYYSMIFESGKRWRLVDSEECFSYYYAGESEYIEKGFMSPSEYMSCGAYYTQMYEYYQQNGASNSQLSEVYEVIQSLAAYSVYCFNPEGPMASALEYVTAEKIPTMYFVTGHGEKSTGSGAVNIGKDGIPDNATMLLINDPDTDFSENEISALIKYSDRGGKLLILTDKNIEAMPNMCRLLASFGLSAEKGIVTVEEKTEFDATVSASAEFLVGAGIDKVNVADVNSIVSAEIKDLEFSPILSIEMPKAEGEETAPQKTVAMAVKKNGSSKLAWFTGADSFNKDTSKMSTEEKQEYAYTAYCIQYTTAWLRTTFTTSLTFPSPMTYTSPMVAVDTGSATWWGILFIGIIPLGLVGWCLINRYTRKRRSATAQTQQEQ